MDQNVERRIRDRAYSIWEKEGRPEGQEVEHWLRACQEVAAEEGSPAASEGSSAESAEAEAPKPKRARATKSTTAKSTTETTAKPRKSTKNG
jgi:hypothetical protein